jgi:hypothetical protein
LYHTEGGGLPSTFIKHKSEGRAVLSFERKTVGWAPIVRHGDLAFDDEVAPSSMNVSVAPEWTTTVCFPTVLTNAAGFSLAK